jgi:hypothetical protein
VTANRRAKRRRPYRWESLEDAELLRLRFSDLRLRIKDSLIWPEVEHLYAELRRRGIRFRPHIWFSTYWFSPDGVPGIAVPFYVGHPRLRALERRMMGDVEGADRKWRLRILRHEAGHALDSAYGIRRRADWRETFGPASTRYPQVYSVRPRSRKHVLHLGHWYAQSHPTEDFAETFAVWLQPKARWRREYAEWPALAKLEYVDELMTECVRHLPKNRDRSVVAPLADNSRTLGEHYRREQKLYAVYLTRYDNMLKRLFAPPTTRPRGVRAKRFISEIEPQLRRLLTRTTRVEPYLVDHAIGTIALRSKQLDLRLRGSRRESKRKVARLLERVIYDVLRRNSENFHL